MENVISELVQIKAEHVKAGYLDLCSKGGKLRRIYIPCVLQKEALEWLKDINKQSGFLFVNKRGERITSRGIAVQLKALGTRYGLDSAVIYPHSFRHRFAKSLFEENQYGSAKYYQSDRQLVINITFSFLEA